MASQCRIVFHHPIESVELDLLAAMQALQQSPRLPARPYQYGGFDGE